MIRIKTKRRTYSIAYAPVMQLIGQNVRYKNEAIDAVRKYFSVERLSEVNKNEVISVEIGEEKVGRKMFRVMAIRDEEDIIAAIRISKNSLLTSYIKTRLSEFNCQEELNRIDEQLASLFGRINKSLEEIGKISLTYSLESVWDMVQKSSIVDSMSEEDISCKEYSELVGILLQIIGGVLRYSPERCLVIIENADHFLSIDEYRELILLAKSITEELDVHFVISTSLDGYVVFDNEMDLGVTVFGDVVGILPDVEHIKNYIEENYPSNRLFSNNEVVDLLKQVSQRLFFDASRSTVQSQILLSLLNESESVYKLEETYNELEVQYLFGKKGGRNGKGFSI